MTATEPGAPEAKARSFGDQLDDSLMESEADEEPPACTACLAMQLPLLGALRALSPPMAISGLPTGSTVEDVTSATAPAAGGAAESIGLRPPVGETADTDAVPHAANTVAVRHTTGTAAVRLTAGADVVPQTANTVAVQQTTGTVAVRLSAGANVVPQTVNTVAVQHTTGTVAVRLSTGADVVPQTANTVAVRQTTETGAVGLSAEAVAVRPSAETLAVRLAAETVAVRPSGDAGDARGLVATAAVPEPAADAKGQHAVRGSAANADPMAGAPPRALTAPFAQERPNQERANDEGRTNAQVARVSAPHGDPSARQPVERRAEMGVARTDEPRVVTGEGRPMHAQATSIDVADSTDVAGVETLASRPPAVAVAAPGGRSDGDGGRRQGKSDQAPIPASAVEGSRAGGETAAASDRAVAGREQPPTPLFSFEPAASTELAPRAMVEAGARMMPAWPPPPAPHTTPMQPAAESVEVPRAAVAPESADSIVQSMRLQYQRGGGDAVVHIKPEHLGPVSVSLRVENGTVSAVVHAESGEVAEWLKANEQVLRDGLASSGLHLERFAVRRDGPPPDRKPWRQPEPPERRRRGLQPESTFEITV